MRTAALLPTPGDPLLARYWLRNYATWRDEVDELIVLVNGDDPDEAAALYAGAGATVHVERTRIGHGEALNALVSRTDADAVVLMEDDAFVRYPGNIRSHLRAAIDNGVIYGCPRGGMSPEVEAAALDKWGPEPIGPDTSRGYGLWPCFLFARTDDLRVPDMRFSSLSWRPGEVIPGLDRSFLVEVTTDTMTLVAFQLRERIAIEPIGQYKEMWQKNLAEMTQRGVGPIWFHAGGLANEPASIRPDIGMDNLEGRDWAHRFWWWRRIGHDYREHWERAAVDPDYWTPIVEPWINWENG